MHLRSYSGTYTEHFCKYNWIGTSRTAEDRCRVRNKQLLRCNSTNRTSSWFWEQTTSWYRLGESEEFCVREQAYKQEADHWSWDVKMSCFHYVVYIYPLVWVYILWAIHITENSTRHSLEREWNIRAHYYTDIHAGRLRYVTWEASRRATGRSDWAEDTILLNLIR